VSATEFHPPLRPLGLGEVLDRAVTLCVKYFVPFATIYLVYAVPLAVITFFATKDFQTMLQSVTDVMQHAGTTGRPASQTAIMQAFTRGGGFNAWTGVLVVMTLLIGPLPTGALIDATASTYLGRLPTFGQSYRVGLARWVPLIGVNVLYFVAGMLLYLAIVIVAGLIFVALAFLTATAHTLGIAVDVAIGIVAAIFGIALAIVVTLALQVSYFTCVVERSNPIVAFTRGIARVFMGVGLKRSLLIGVAFIAISVAIGIISFAGQAILAGLFRSGIAGSIYETLVRIATAAFTTAFIGIFYFDLRVREEGLDLTLAAQSARAGILETT